MENNFQTEFEYWQNEVVIATKDWLEEVDKFHKYMNQFFIIGINNKIEHEATKGFDREEFVKINKMRDIIEEKREKLQNLHKIWLSLKK